MTAGAVTINAASTNLVGNITIGGPLTALTLHNWQSGTLSAGGASATLTTINGNLFDNDAISLGSTLNKLTVAEFTSAGANPSTPSISAAAFGALNVIGNAAANSAAISAPTSPTLPARRLPLPPPRSRGLFRAIGIWPAPSARSRAGATQNWNLGLVNGPGVVNSGRLTNVASLTLGVAAAVTISSAGRVASLTATSLNDFNSGTDAILGALQAVSFGTITTTGSTSLNDHGNLAANITATGNAGGTLFQAVASLTVNGDLGIAGLSTPDTLLLQNGNVGAITVLRQVDDAFIDAVPTTNGGAITAISAGQWPGSNLAAKSVGTWKIMGNLAAQMLGDFTNSTVTLAGAGSTAAARDISTAHDVTGSSFTIVNGGLTGFFVGSTGAASAAVGELQDTDITLESASAGNLGAIAAAQWQNSNVTARTIGTLKVWARPAAASTTAFNGDMLGSNIFAFEAPGAATPGIGTFFVAGQLAASGYGGNFILANNGITSFTVGRNVGASGTSFQISAALNGGAGGIGTLTAGSWANTDLAAYFLGAVHITGFSAPEQSTGHVNGDFTNSDVVINGNNNAAPKQGIASMTVKGQLNTTFFNVPAGIGTLSVTDAATDNFLDLANALTTSGALTTFTAGNIDQLNLDANTAGTIRTSGSLALGLNGDVTSLIAAIAGYAGSASAPVGLGTLAVAGNFTNDILQVKDGIGAGFSVAQELSNATIAVAYDGTNSNANVKLLSRSAWSSASLVADSVTSFTVTGIANFDLAGNLSSSRITLLGVLANVALGTFAATGSVSSSTFQISGGNVPRSPRPTSRTVIWTSAIGSWTRMILSTTQRTTRPPPTGKGLIPWPPSRRPQCSMRWIRLKRQDSTTATWSPGNWASSRCPALTAPAPAGSPVQSYVLGFRHSVAAPPAR